MKKNRGRISWCQKKIMEQLPDDGKWHDVMASWNSKTAIHFGPCAKSTVIRGLVARGLVEHRQKPNDPIAWMKTIIDGQIRRVSSASVVGREFEL